LASSCAPRPANAIEYAALVSNTAKLLVDAIGNAGIAFERASSPSGSPELYRRAFLSILSDLATARVALDEVDPPDSLRRSQSALQAFLGSLYHQLAAWPKRVSQASESVTGNKLDLELSAAADLEPFERAFAEESGKL
jgi:hypothetical protein